MRVQDVMNETMCLNSRIIATHFLYVFPQILWGLSAILAVLILGYSFFTYGFRLLFHHNAKVLMILLTLFCLVFSIDVALFSVMQVWNAMTYSNDCDVVYLTSFCTLFRRVALTCFVGVSTTQLFQMAERLVATILIEKYDTHLHWLGGMFVLFSVLTAMLTIEWVLWEEDPLETMTHCLAFSTSPTIGPRMYAVFYGILLMDLLILAVFLFLYWHNKKKVLTAGLNHKYQQQENLTVLRALFPMVLLNTVFVSIYISTVTIGRQFKDKMTITQYKYFAINTFIFPYVSLFLSITVYLTAKREHQRKLQRIHATKGKDASSSSKTYFSLYESQWQHISHNK